MGVWREPGLHEGAVRLLGEGFDWRRQEAAINRSSHFKAPVAGIDMHYIPEKGSGPAPMPLLIADIRTFAHSLR